MQVGAKKVNLAYVYSPGDNVGTLADTVVCAPAFANDCCIATVLEADDDAMCHNGLRVL